MLKLIPQVHVDENFTISTISFILYFFSIVYPHDDSLKISHCLMSISFLSHQSSRYKETGTSHLIS